MKIKLIIFWLCYLLITFISNSLYAFSFPLYINNKTQQTLFGSEFLFPNTTIKFPYGKNIARIDTNDDATSYAVFYAASPTQLGGTIFFKTAQQKTVCTIAITPPLSSQNDGHFITKLTPGRHFQCHTKGVIYDNSEALLVVSIQE